MTLMLPRIVRVCIAAVRFYRVAILRSGNVFPVLLKIPAAGGVRRGGCIPRLANNTICFYFLV